MPTALYEIKGKHNASAINDAKAGLQGLGQVASNVNKIFAGFVATKAVQFVGKAVGESIRAFQTEQTSLAQLTNSIKNNANLTADSFKRINTFASQLQGKGIYGDEEIRKQATYLANLNLTEDKIKQTLDAAANWAATGQVSFETAVQGLGKSWEGVGTSIGKTIPMVRGMTEEQLRAGGAIALVSKQFGGALETAASTLEGRTVQIQNVIGDIREKFGAIFGVAKMGILEALMPVFQAIDNWLGANLPKILNFFINFPQIAGMAFATAGNMLKTIFTLDFWINYFSATGKYIVDAMKVALNILWELVKAIAVTIWEPLKWAWDNLVYYMQKVFTDVVNGIIGGINWVIEAINRFTGTKINVMGTMTAPENRVDQNPDAKIFAAWKDLGKNTFDELKKLGAALVQYGKDATAPLAPMMSDFVVQLEGILGQELPENIKAFLSGGGGSGVSSVAASVAETGGGWTDVYDANDEVFKQKTSTIFDTLLEKAGGVQGVMSSVGNAVGGVAGGFISAAMSMGPMGILMEALKYVLKGIMSVLGPIIDSLLKPLIGILMIVGQTIGKILVPVLKLLEPIILMFTRIFIFAYNNVIMPIGNALIFIFTAIYNAFAFVYNLISKIIRALTFGLVNLGQVSYQNYDDMKLNKIDEGSLNDAANDSGEYSNSGGGQSASYTGTRDITVNIFYNNSYVNGDARQIALSIREELALAQSLGM